jgi:hypothetical protein
MFVFGLLAGGACTLQAFANIDAALPLSWDNGTGTADTALSRVSAGELAVGGGVAGDYSGSLQLSTLYLGAREFDDYNGSLASWTNVTTCATDSVNTDGGSSTISVPTGQQCHINAGIAANTTFQFDFNILGSVTPWFDVQFGYSAAGHGTGFRIDLRGSEPSGIEPTENTTWVMTHANAGPTIVCSASTWYTVKIVINAAGTSASWYLNGALQQSGIAIHLDGPYIGFNNANGGATVVNFGNISVASNVAIAGGVASWGGNTGISRLGAASLAIGNGTAGDFSGSLKLTTVQLSASSGAPSSSGTAGTAGQIIYYGGLIYFCSVTGAVGSATWNKLSMTSV